MADNEIPMPIAEVGEGRTVYSAHTGEPIDTLYPTPYNGEAWGIFKSDGTRITNPEFEVIERVAE